MSARLYLPAVLTLGIALSSAPLPVAPGATTRAHARAAEPTIAGRVTFIRTMQSDILDHTTIAIQMTRLDAPGSPVTSPINRDGTFALTASEPGRYALSAVLPPAFERWWLQSAVVDGRDLLDSAIEATPAVHVSGVLLTFIDRRPELAGRVQSSQGGAVADAPVVVFPVAEPLRAAPRRVRWMRSDATGRYAFRDLPSGEYWIAVLSEFDPRDLADSLFFDVIGAIAMKTSLGDLEKKTLDLTAK